MGFALALKSIDVSIAYAVSYISAVEMMTEALFIVWMHRTHRDRLCLHFPPKDMGFCRHSNCFRCRHRLFWRAFEHGKNNLSCYDTLRCCWVGIDRRTLKPKEIIDGRILIKLSKTKHYLIREMMRRVQVGKIDHLVD